jgi:hypothetical protein
VDPQKTPSSIIPYYLCVFTNQLPRNRRPIVARVGSRGNVFTGSLPSNGSVCHNVYTQRHKESQATEEVRDLNGERLVCQPHGQLRRQKKFQ